MPQSRLLVFQTFITRNDVIIRHHPLTHLNTEMAEKKEVKREVKTPKGFAGLTVFFSNVVLFETVNPF